MNEYTSYRPEPEGKIYPPAEQAMSERAYEQEYSSERAYAQEHLYRPPSYHHQPQQQNYMYPGTPQPPIPLFIPVYVPVHAALAPYPVIAPPDRHKEVAVAGFVLGIVSLVGGFLPCGLGLLIPFVGIVLSALGLQSTQRKGLAIAGLILSPLGLLLSGLIVLISLFLFL